jgi:hypothetical protein
MIMDARALEDVGLGGKPTTQPRSAAIAILRLPALSAATNTRPCRRPIRA